MKSKKLKIGVAIPCLLNNEVAEELFSQLYEKIKQIKERPRHYDLFVEIYFEDLNNVVGISKARNICIGKLFKRRVDYIVFLDADDMIDEDFFDKIYFACLENYDIIETRFKILKGEVEFNPKEMKSHVTGIAFKREVIGKHRFDENILFGEDRHFIDEVVDLSKQTRCQVDTIYHYNYGYNKDCLSYRFSRGEINERR